MNGSAPTRCPAIGCPMRSARANGQPAFTCYLDAVGHHASEPSGLVVLTLADERIAAVTRFLDPGLTVIFGRYEQAPAQ